MKRVLLKHELFKYSSPRVISEARPPVILAGRVVELRCNGWRVLLLKAHKRRANPSQNVTLKDGEEMRGYYQMAAAPKPPTLLAAVKAWEGLNIVYMWSGSIPKRAH